MGSLTNAWEVNIMSFLLGINPTLAVPPTLRVALFATSPNPEGTFSFATEPTIGTYAYSRPAWAPGSAQWNIVGRVASNKTAITFPTATGGNWGSITYWALCNHASNKNQDTPIFWGQLSGSGVTIVDGQTFFIQAGGLSVTIPTGFFSDYLADLLLKHFFFGTALPQPTDLYVAASTENPGDTGATIAEPSDAAYARSQPATGWEWLSGSTYANDGAIEFPTATQAWGDIDYTAVFDAITSGHMLFYGALTNAVTVNAGFAFQFLNNALTLTLD